MAANDYLKQASAMLRRAAEAMKTEMNDLNRQISSVQSEKSMQIHQVQREELQHQAEVAAANSGDEERQKLRAVQEARQAQANIEREKQDLKAQMTNRINQLQIDHQDIMQQAKDLEQRAAMM